MISNRITQNEDELKEIQNQYLIEMSKICQLSEKEIKFFLTKLKNSDTVSNSYRKVLIDTFVNAVYVYDNEIILIYNVGNKSITINIDLLSDIEKELVTERLGFLKRFGSPKSSYYLNSFFYYFIYTFQVFLLIYRLVLLNINNQSMLQMLLNSYILLLLNS